MSFTKSKFRHPKLPTNRRGFTRASYEGAISTLCAGCGHDSISAAIIQACYELELEPHKIAKMSGIGCSSKTPTYFLGKSHGFNSVHGRMPSVATGANLANKDLTYIGVSGDGDTASIGMGQFIHVIRRNLNMLYIVENNGCYGLTKGQDSATADEGSVNKKGIENPFYGLDLASLALQAGASFVGRSFSGDKNQLIPLIKAGLTHKGFAFLDVISPCVTFNNHEHSTKSYGHVRDSKDAVPLDFIAHQDEITAEYDPGSTQEVKMHDGSYIRLYKSREDYDISDPFAALTEVAKYNRQGKILTGLLHADTYKKSLHETLNTSDTPLQKLGDEDLIPDSEFLATINQSLR